MDYADERTRIGDTPDDGPDFDGEVDMRKLSDGQRELCNQIERDAREAEESMRRCPNDPQGMHDWVATDVRETAEIMEGNRTGPQRYSCGNYSAEGNRCDALATECPDCDGWGERDVPGHRAHSFTCPSCGGQGIRQDDGL